MPRKDDAVYDVWLEGARANASMACLPFFQAAYGKHKTRSSVTVIPENWSTHANPFYYVASNWMGSIGTAADAHPGGKTDWRGRVVLQAGPVVLPSGHSFVGSSCGLPRNDTAMYGPALWAASGYTGTNNRLVQLGADNYTTDFPDSTRIEKMTINGRSISNIIGVYSNSIQEASGVFDSGIVGCHHGIVFEGGANVGPANFSLERLHLVAVTSSSGNGVNVYGNNYLLNKITVANTHTTTNGDSAFILRGTSCTAQNLHFEGYDYGVDIGGTDPGVGSDTGFWIYNMSVNGVTGFTGATQPALTAAVRIRNVDTHVFNVSIRNVSLHLYRSAVNLIQDDVNGIVIPASATNLHVGSYEFGGNYSTTSGSTVKRPVYTSYYNHLAAPNAAVKALAAAADLDRSFTGGGRAGIIQLTGATTIARISNPQTGDQVYLHILSGTPTLDHANVAGTAAERLICSTSADIVTSAGQFYRCTYGDIRGFAIDATDYASRWFVELVS